MNPDFFKFILSLLLFGSNGIVASQIALSSSEIVFLRTLIGGIFLLCIFLSAKQRFGFWRHKKEAVLLLISGVSMGISWMFLYEAYQQVGVGTAILLHYTAPILVMLLSPVFFQERLTKKKSFGFVIVLLGILLINGQAAQTGKSLWGILSAILSAVAYAVVMISGKKRSHIIGLENTVLQLFLAFLVVAAYLLFQQKLPFRIPEGDLPFVLMLGIVNGGMGCYFFFSTISRLPVQTVAVCSYLDPLMGVVLSALVLGEAMGILQITGAALILGGTLFAEMAGRR